MALTSGTLLGTYSARGKSFPVYALAFTEGGNLQVAQEVVKDQVYVIRNKNFVLSTTHSFTQHSAFTDALAATLPEGAATDTGGYNAPSGFVAPNGWAIVAEAGSGNPLLVKAGYSNTSIIDDTANGSGTIVSRSASFVDTAVNFVKEQPALALGGVLLLAFIIHTIMQSGKKKKSKFLGIL